MLVRAIMFMLAVGLVVGCGGGQGENVPMQQDQVSQCGGFTGGEGLFYSPAIVPEDYCSAERLFWRYSAESSRLEVTNTRVLLNCCGEHSFSVEHRSDGSWWFEELDEPMPPDARCGCMCVFDFAIRVEQVPAGVLDVVLVRTITDNPDDSGTVFQGQIDLSAGEGSIVIDDNPVDPWCEHHAG